MSSFIEKSTSRYRRGRARLPRTVTAEITGTGDKTLVELTVDVDGTAGTQTDTLTATDNHPFWIPELGQWKNAADLKPGQWLQTSAGTWVQLTATRSWVEHRTVHNLTIGDLHTYYVLAGATPVLVHNCGDEAGEVGEVGEATVHLANYPDGHQHAFLTIRHGDTVLRTHQFGRPGSPNGVTTFEPSEVPAITLNVKIPLPRPLNAVMKAEDAMYKTDMGRYPPYDMPNQACVTYCAQVLNAAGVDMPTRNDKAIDWLLARHR
ncbi:HINT domain-containing protein [Embleya sp. NBC_00888]|uniref:polymorphic toxin-type HINT domain-containing protein n=1 Tax=Embleya sp. NBC_00888 TaxID=2975960 RepID=UPI00386F7428|nr:HINT domain-containing protein [Embleya sp. NBC_00888]